MDTIAQSFLAEIEAYLASTGTDATAFGKQALGDPSFVFDLRKGRSPQRAPSKNSAPSSAAPTKRQKSP